MPSLKTPEGLPHYIRYARARYVDNRKSLRRSSDALALHGRCCAALALGPAPPRPDRR
jgi:hypothetical protein